jgi:hypothetical protein
LLIRSGVVAILLRTSLHGVGVQSVAAATAASVITTVVAAIIVAAIVAAVIALAAVVSAIVALTTVVAATASSTATTSKSTAAELSSLESASQGVSFLDNSSFCNGRDAQKSNDYAFDLHCDDFMLILPRESEKGNEAEGKYNVV